MDAPVFDGGAMNAKTHESSKVGAGKSIINRHERSFKRGTLMFIEGESSAEMFIIRSGLIRILKQEGQNTIELAQLGPGSVLGELSLLDHQPRSATAQVIEDTTVTVIDEELFTRTLKNIPSWLENMIQLVVKRLRDTMKKTGDDIVRKSIPGVIQILLLMYGTKKKTTEDEVVLPVVDVREQVLAVIGLGTLELENVFLHCILKEMLLIRKDDSGREFVVLKEPDALRLYLQYLRMHQNGATLVGENFTDNTVALINVVIDAARRNGAVVAKNTYRISEQQIEIELERQGRERFIDRDALDELVEARLMIRQSDTTETRHGHHTRDVFICKSDLLESVLLLKKWLPVFNEEITF